MPTIVSKHHTGSFGARSRLLAAAIHFAISIAVAALAALLVFALWYPYPYRDVSGGRELFFLVVSVDMVIGPLITFAVFNRAKPAAELRLDLAIVGMLQLAALGYGLWTVHLARPVHLVFEYDRFRVVHQVDIPVELQGKAPPGIELVPFGRPTVLALRPLTDEKEKFELTVQALQGVQLAARPDLWRPYSSERPAVLKAAHPAATLLARFPQRAIEIEAAVRRTGRPLDQVAYLPMLARKAVAWCVLLDATNADILGYLPLDPY